MLTGKGRGSTGTCVNSDLGRQPPRLLVEADALLVLGCECVDELFTVALIQLQLTAQTVRLTAN